eukprot:GGOE01014665.1.p1 GENE.GGOE01014665.1~~GGOE01014665.1.p1  ORF type:complete len:796 (+),score=223.61 GGOE01014665.1:48-2435(+)
MALSRAALAPVPPPLSFATLVERSDTFAQTVCSFPSFQSNLIQSVVLARPGAEAEVVQHAERAHAIVHARLRPLVKEFLFLKMRHGSPAEHAMYAKLFAKQVVATDIVERAFYQRLLTRRPICCWLGLDSFLLSEVGGEGFGRHVFPKVGTPAEVPPLLLSRVLSRDEVQVSAFIGLASETHFVNNGDDLTCAYRMKPGTYQPSGVLIGICGPRLEHRGCSEWPHLLVTAEQNTKENGYGAEGAMAAQLPPSHRLLGAWARLYREGDTDRARFYFPTWAEAEAEQRRGGDAYAPLAKGLGLLNTRVFKQRLLLVLEPLLLEANDRALARKCKAYVHLSLFDLTFEAEAIVDDAIQAKLFAEVCDGLLRSLPLPHISDVHFAGFAGLTLPPEIAATVSEAENRIRLHTADRQLADPLDDPTKLLVGMYALNGNAIVGNEYWLGLYSFSSNSLAASCSTIPQLQNPFVNPRICSDTLKYHGKPPPKYRRGEIAEKFGKYRPDKYDSLEALQAALAEYGVESCNLVIGVDFTASNLEQGKYSFAGKSLHHISNDGNMNPYQKVISVICRTLQKFDEDNHIPAFGFGDYETRDTGVFPFWPDGRECEGLEEVLTRYNAVVQERILSGPTNFAPLIDKAIDIVSRTGKYHILVIVADGQVTSEEATIAAIQRASNYALSIVCVGVGDGPWHRMENFDDRIRDRWFYNFHFVDFFQTISGAKNVETSFAHCTLSEIPQQYHAIKQLGLLGSSEAPLQYFEASVAHGLVSVTFAEDDDEPIGSHHILAAQPALLSRRIPRTA